MSATILGVDPGGSTGLVVRCGNDLLWHATVTGDWEDVLDQLQDLPPVAGFIEAVAIEAVTAPRGFADGKKAPINPAPLITTATVAGAVAAWAWVGPIPIVWIPPGHNGQGAMESYPAVLRPNRGKGKGHDALRHVRSSWDVAGMAALELRSRGAA